MIVIDRPAGRTQDKILAAALHPIQPLLPTAPIESWCHSAGHERRVQVFDPVVTHRTIAKDYRLKQEYNTPYTPEENGLIERFIRSFKEECAWLNNFTSIEQARSVVAPWIDWYNRQRPHQALGYKAPAEYQQTFRAKLSA